MLFLYKEILIHLHCNCNKLALLSGTSSLKTATECVEKNINVTCKWMSFLLFFLFSWWWRAAENSALQLHHSSTLETDISKGRSDWFWTWAAIFFSLQTEWLSHPKLNGFTQQRRKGGRREEKQVSWWHGRMGILQNSIRCSDPDRTQQISYHIISYYLS